MTSTMIYARPEIKIAIRRAADDQTLVVAHSVGYPSPTELPAPYEPGDKAEEDILQIVGDLRTLHPDTHVGEIVPLRIPLPMKGRRAEITVEVLSIEPRTPEPDEVTLLLRVDGPTVIRDHAE